MYFKITSFDLMETNQEKKQSFNAKCMFDLRLKTIQFSAVLDLLDLICYAILMKLYYI